MKKSFQTRFKQKEYLGGFYLGKKKILPDEHGNLEGELVSSL